VNYAINGAGAGQVQRLVAITRWLRRYGMLHGDAVEPYFLTSTEAENVVFAEHMAAFKIPSMAAAQAAELDPRRYLALAKQWIWHSLGLLQPDILIVDTWPRGAFGELLNAFDLCRKRIFIYGPESHQMAEAADFQAMLPLYDLILVPEREGAMTLPFGKADPTRIQWVGPIMSRERVELLERWDARERLGAPPDRFVLYISAGGGADSDAQELLLSICTAVVDVPDVHLVIGGGPLYSGSVLQGPRITWLNAPGAELMLGFDAAISTAGYSEFNELLFAEVPTAWIPLGDDQNARAQHAAASGAAIVLDPEDLRGSVVLAALDRLREPSFRQLAAEKAALLVPANFARDAAQAVLSTLYEARDVVHAAMAIDDEVLRTAAESSLSVHAIVTLARWISREPRPSQSATKAACALMEAMFVHALHPPLGSKIVEPLSRVLPMDQPARRAQAIIALLDAFACFEDWGATLVFLDALVPETIQSLERFQANLEALLQESTDQGMSLQDIATTLVATRKDCGCQSEAIEELLARLSEASRPLRRDAS
jgi:UDP-N-acetylglucosamine--N-acetylmuramyl-(pentapeptide) pyrophosphoryl-undecaprenol N-acetylglucosamine transferase